MESPEEEKIDIYLKIIRTVAFKVNKSSKIKDLKSLFSKKEGVEENLQELFCDGRSLSDEWDLVSHGIKSYSTLNLYLRGDSTKLLINIPSSDDGTTKRRKIELEPTMHDTVKNIKYLIQAKERIKIDSFALFYNAKQLENEMTLASLKIPNESVFRLVFTPSDSLSVSVELLSGEVLKLEEVKYMHRIRDLKEMILSNGPLLARGNDLIYEGKQLEDDKTVAFYDIKPNSTLQVTPLTFQILVTENRTNVFWVKQTDTVLDVKKMISIKLGYPSDAFYLITECRYLKEDRNLASYGIGELNILWLRFNFHWLKAQEGYRS